MRSVRARLVACGGIIAVLAAGCGDDESGSGDSSNPVTAQMRSWDGCEVLDNLQPIWDYMQIEAIQGKDNFNSTKWGQGLDQQAATCSGLVTVMTWTYPDGSPRPNSGELWVSIVPWDTEQQARDSYTDRTVDDLQARFRQNSTLTEVDRTDLGSEWDQGELIVLEDEQDHLLDAYGRDGTWLLHVSIRYNDNSGKEYFRENRDRLPGKTVEDYTYPFEDKQLRRWLVDEYVPATHQAITDRIG